MPETVQPISSTPASIYNPKLLPPQMKKKQARRIERTKKEKKNTASLRDQRLTRHVRTEHAEWL